MVVLRKGARVKSKKKQLSEKEEKSEGMVANRKEREGEEEGKDG